jgi:DedD protein
MGLLSSLRKDKQESTSDDSDFYSRAEDNVDAPPSRRRRAGKLQDKEAIDPVLPEKKRARRRLIGAIAMVLAAVIGLPMILDSEPKPLATDIAIQIPSRDAPIVRPAPQVGKPESEPEPAPSAPTDTPIATQQAESSSAAPEPASSVASVQKQSASQPVVVKPGPTAKDKPAPANTAAKSDDADRARAILAGKSNAVATKSVTERERKADKFVVQVAALASQEKVAELQAKLKKAGIKSYTQKVATQSGERIRIRIGPFASRDEADKMRSRVAKLGLNGSLVPA